MNPEEYLKEDFEATGHSRYTVDGLEKNDPDGWTRQLLTRKKQRQLNQKQLAVHSTTNQSIFCDHTSIKDQLKAGLFLVNFWHGSSGCKHLY
ncbi:hypothetical protein BTI59_07510 [Lactobacillus delbrueckii subsp. bulgaricus]|nr:hypothetical protein [Lactobacillus delbrueckii subsp. bulgaricus]